MSRLLALFLAVMISGCSGTIPNDNIIKFPDISSRDPNGVLIFSLGADISVLDPVLSSDSASSAVEGLIFTGLTKVNEQLEIVPDIAKRWTVSADGRTYTFFLRDDIYWHDGEKCTASDVKFTFDTILDPKVNSVRRGDYIINGVPIRFFADSPYIFRAVLPEPFAPFLAAVGMGLLPEHLLKGKDVNSDTFNQHPVGTGPFIFKEWAQSDHILLEKNKKYYGGEPLLSKIMFRIIPDENTSLLALKAGEVDESGIPPKDYKRTKKDVKLNVFEYEAMQYVYLGFNLLNPIFSDMKVRQSFAYATDKKQLVDLIFRGLADPAYSPSSPVSWSYEKNVDKYEYDPKKAADLLDGAGWKIGKDNIRYKNGKPLEFSILVNQGNKEREKAAVILEWQYKKIGAIVKIRMMEWSAMLRILSSSKLPRDFDALIIGWSLGIDPDSYSIWHSSQFPNGLNFIGYTNCQVDRLLEKGRTTIHKDKRKNIYSDIQKILAHEQPYIFLWYPRSVSAVSKRVGGLSAPGPAGLFLNIEKVYVR